LTFQRGTANDQRGTFHVVGPIPGQPVSIPPNPPNRRFLFLEKNDKMLLALGMKSRSSGEACAEVGFFVEFLIHQNPCGWTDRAEARPERSDDQSGHVDPRSDCCHLQHLKKKFKYLPSIPAPAKGSFRCL
jgi:hypothetical protein